MACKGKMLCDPEDGLQPICLATITPSLNTAPTLPLPVPPPPPLQGSELALDSTKCGTAVWQAQ